MMGSTGVGMWGVQSGWTPQQQQQQQPANDIWGNFGSAPQQVSLSLFTGPTPNHFNYSNSPLHPTLCLVRRILGEISQPRLLLLLIPLAMYGEHQRLVPPPGRGPIYLGNNFLQPLQPRRMMHLAICGVDSSNGKNATGLGRPMIRDDMLRSFELILFRICDHLICSFLNAPCL